MSDGPIQFVGTLDDHLNIENVSRFGRSFSIVRIPYSFKLLLQELQTMNVQMRIITEDNIDQLTNMSYSDNISKILGKNITDTMLSKAIKILLSNQKLYKNKRSQNLSLRLLVKMSQQHLNIHSL